jgi:hypothetical protein
MTREHRIPEHLARLLVSSIESLDRLDVLLHLRTNRGRSFGAGAVARALRISSVFVEQHLAILCGRGFLTVSIGTDLLYGYQPASDAIELAMREIEDLNRERRADIATLLQARTGREPPHVFADAFVIRKSNKKGTKDG